MPGGAVVVVSPAGGPAPAAVSALIGSCGWPVYAATPDRLDGREAAALKAEGAALVRVSHTEISALEAVFRRPGVHGVFFYPPDILDEKMLTRGVAVIAAAKRAGVKHFVLSSAAVLSGAPPVRANTDMADLEAWLRQSGMQTTILRPVYLMENHLTRHPPTRGQLHGAPLLG
mmetsp:Transcript_30171/g.76041  ORF Transcript_30171/g.76041 Transcript_30171/m.76041 type:complete len:173 (+) Transcript_30171:59-577(+)